jgi:polyisoprenyl-phosphate glycosyltransferase
MKKISIVIPFFNEEPGIKFFFDSLLVELKLIQGCSFELVLVDDGSEDKSLQSLIQLKSSEHITLKVIELSKNFGKESALTAGIHNCSGDAVIFMDSDLEHPPAVINQMINKWQEGCDVVLGKRSSRENEKLFKRVAVKIFYRIYSKLSQFKTYPGVGEFRLMNRASLEALKSLEENQRFMRGLMSWAGFKEEIIEFEPVKRKHGETKYSYFKLFLFAIDGITNFSIAPLRLSIFLGIFFAFLAVLYAAFLFWEFSVHGVDVSGFPTLILAIVFFGSVNLIMMGIIGEYIGKIFLESKKRPSFIIRKIHYLD